MANARMTHSQLIRHLAGRCQVSNKKAHQFLEELAQTARRETQRKGIFVLPDIGRLVKAHRQARVGRNPATGQTIRIPAKTVVKFRVAKVAKESIAPSKAKTVSA